jgi:hypothetical protein
LIFFLSYFSSACVPRVLHSRSSILDPRSFLIGLLLTGWLATSLRADEPPATRQVQVVDSAGSVRNGFLKELGASLVTLTSSEQFRLKTRDLVLMKFKDRTSSLAPDAPLVTLSAGDVLAVRPESIDDESLIGRWARFPEWPLCKVPLETVRGAILEPPSGAAARARLLDRVFDFQEPRDSIILRNGDLLAGEFLSLDEKAVQFETSLGKSAVERTGILAMIFNPALASREPVPGEMALVSLVDGSRFRAKDLKFSAPDRLSMKAQFGAQLDLPLTAVESLRFLGGCATYLSDITPVEYKFDPFLDLEWPLHRDRGVAGGFLSLGRVEYPKGLGMHSRSAVTYRLDGKFRRFHATIGIDDSAAGRGSVVFAISLDGKTACKSDVLTGTSSAVTIDRLDVTGAKLMTLSADFATDGDILDHADWCDALLIR